MDVPSIKAAFFDRAAVTSKIPPAVKSALSRFGAMARQDIRKSLKYSDKPSRPGRPPAVHKGKAGKSPLRELTFYAFDAGRESVIIGPALGGDQDGAPEKLEGGGTVAVIDEGESKVLRIAPRPYVGPVFKKLRGKAPELFGGLIR